MSSPQTRDDLRRQTMKETRQRVFKKSSVIFFALIAFMSLKSLETAKSEYAKEKNAPLIVVDGFSPTPSSAASSSASPSPASTPEVARLAGSGTVELKAAEVVTMLAPKDEKPPASDKEKQKAEEEERRRNNMLGYVNAVKHQNYRNTDELVGRLNEEVAAKWAADRKTHFSTMDAIVKDYVTRKSKITSEINGTINELGRHLEGPAIAALKNELEAELSRSPRKADGGACDRLDAKIKPSCRTLKTQMGEDKDLESRYREVRARIQGDIAAVNGKEEEDIKAIFLKKAELDRAVGAARGGGGDRSSLLKYFNARVMLDEGSESHVIYQTVRLVCVAVLVFGVLFVLVTLLSPLPFFEGGAGALTEHAKGFFSRPGGDGKGPELARALVVGATALGIGTAVLVADGTGGKPTRIAGVSGYEIEEGQPGKPGAGGRTGGNVFDRRRWNLTAEGPQVEVTAPVVYPSPMTINQPVYVPTIDGRALDGVRAEIGGLRDTDSRLGERLSQVAGQVGPMQKEVATLAGLVDNVNVRDLHTNTSALPPLVAQQGGQIGGLQSEMRQLQDSTEKNLIGFRQGMDAATLTLSEMRDDLFAQPQRPEGRNLFTRMKQLVAPERYAVTPQSYRTLESMICKNLQCTDPNARAVVAALAKMQGTSPQGASEFVRALGIADSALKPWKSIILRYARIP